MGTKGMRWLRREGDGRREGTEGGGEGAGRDNERRFKVNCHLLFYNVTTVCCSDVDGHCVRQDV